GTSCSPTRCASGARGTRTSSRARWSRRRRRRRSHGRRVLQSRARTGLAGRSKLRLAAPVLLVAALAACTPSLYGWTVRTSSTPTLGWFSPWPLEREPVAIFEAHAPGGLRGNELGLAGYLAEVLKTVAPDFKVVS